tara:strand:+ start:445 stop:1797 length:1353 start_codon:yes stop_codon:yes gene_type:complete
MPTVSPYYQQRGIANPYYVLDAATVTQTLSALKREGIDQKQLLFKSVESIQGKTIIKSSGKYKFQLASDKAQDLPYGIETTKKQVKGHLGMTSRKDSTASSNVNEFLTVYFLVNPSMTPEQLENHSCKQGNASTGVLTGEGTSVTFEDLCKLIDADETAARDIKIGLNNSKAVRKDINGKGIQNLYWVPRGKPTGISPKTPSDVIIEFNDGFFRGYSNKISAGKTDDTPKFNTNIYAFYGKLGDGTQQANIGSIIDESWNQSAATVRGERARDAIESFDISQEKFSETSSRAAFAGLAKSFKENGLEFYGKDFYYKFRNNLIKNFSNYLLNPLNMIYFLNTIYFYTYDDPNQAFTPCPYKLLVGRETGESTIKDVSENESLKELLINKNPARLSGIKSSYDGQSQSFTITLNFTNGELKNVRIPITCRTRSAGGWAGKSLFISTSGVQMS